MWFRKTTCRLHKSVILFHFIFSPRLFCILHQFIHYFMSLWFLRLYFWGVFSFKDAHPAEILLVATAAHNRKTSLVHDQTSLLIWQSVYRHVPYFLSVLLVMMHHCVSMFFKHKLFRVTNIRSNFLFLCICIVQHMLFSLLLRKLSTLDKIWIKDKQKL